MNNQFVNAVQFAKYDAMNAATIEASLKLYQRLDEDSPEEFQALMEEQVKSMDLESIRAAGMFDSYENWKAFSIKINTESSLFKYPEFAEVRPVIMEALQDDAWMRHLWAQITPEMFSEAQDAIDNMAALASM